MQEDDTKLNPEDCHIVLECQQVLEIEGAYVRQVDSIILYSLLYSLI